MVSDTAQVMSCGAAMYMMNAPNIWAGPIGPVSAHAKRETTANTVVMMRVKMYFICLSVL